MHEDYETNFFSPMQFSWKIGEEGKIEIISCLRIIPKEKCNFNFNVVFFSLPDPKMLLPLIE